MKVAIIGGTGRVGQALAPHLSKSNEVKIGSRDREKAGASAARIPGTSGGTYEEVSSWCDAAVLAVPFSAVGSLGTLAKPLAGKLVVSVVNPLKRDGDVLQYAMADGSAAQTVASLLPDSRVATAFNNVPVTAFGTPPGEEVDILVAADSLETFKEVAGLIQVVPRMRAVYVGPLTQAQSVERLTVLVLNAAKLSGGPRLSVKFVS